MQFSREQPYLAICLGDTGEEDGTVLVPVAGEEMILKLSVQTPWDEQSPRLA